MQATHEVLLTIADAVDLISVGICLVGAIKFVWGYLWVEIARLGATHCAHRIQAIRRMLGGYILVSLELMIVSDVLSSVVSTDLESLGNLGAIVVLRTTIGFFLSRELQEQQDAST